MMRRGRERRRRWYKKQAARQALLNRREVRHELGRHDWATRMTRAGVVFHHITTAPFFATSVAGFHVICWR